MVLTSDNPKLCAAQQSCSAAGDSEMCHSRPMTVADYSAAPLARKKRFSGRGKPRLSRSGSRRFVNVASIGSSR